MSVCGARHAACACTACARPISPPSGVTALLSAMFCGLNGATAMPCRTSQRHSAATSVLLPASEVVPWTISVQALIVALRSRQLPAMEFVRRGSCQSEPALSVLQVYARLGAHAGAERMFDIADLAHRVCH